MYSIYGNPNGQTIFVAIPALGERKEMFYPLASTLSEYKWIAFDLPGSNKQKLEDYSFKSFCTYIFETLNSLNINKAHFIGNSIGAWMIQAFTTMYPEKVASLTLLDGGHYFLGEREDNFEYTELASGIEHLSDIKEAVHQLVHSFPNLEEENYTHFEQYMVNNYIQLDDGYAHHCDEIAYNALSKEVTTHNYCLQEFNIPISLFIAGASADNFSALKVEGFAKKFPQATIETIPNGQHYLPITNTNQTACALVKFYNSTNFLAKL